MSLKIKSHPYYNVTDAGLWCGFIEKEHDTDRWGVNVEFWCPGLKVAHIYRVDDSFDTLDDAKRAVRLAYHDYQQYLLYGKEK